MPKNKQDLIESRMVKDNLVSKWGLLPSSIFKVDWSKSKNIELTGREYQQHKDKVIERYGDKSYGLSGVGARHGDLSRFPQDLGTFLVNFYCKDNGFVVDPFAGHNSRAEFVWRSHRNYIGFDISHKFIELNNKVKELLYKENTIIKNEHTIEFIEHDSRYMLEKVSENIADFIITSPPFYDIEDYGPEAQQLSNCKTYTEFMYGLEHVFSNCYKILKDECFIAIECNDFRKNGIFYLYHSDTISRLQRIGFTIHDIIVVDYGAGFLRSFASEMEQYKIVSKEHSYIIVGRKYMKKNESNKEVKKGLSIKHKLIINLMH